MCGLHHPTTKSMTSSVMSSPSSSPLPLKLAAKLSEHLEQLVARDAALHMTSQGTPHGRFTRAIKARQLYQAEIAARDTARGSHRHGI
jgi:hypothetical protein